MPIGAIAQGVLGGIQAVGGAIGAKRAENALERMSSPIYKGGGSIMDFYNQALQRYNTSPTDTALYKRSMSNIGRNTATALGALGDRRSGLAGASSILRASNDAALNADVAAEGEQSNRFAQLGGASQMKSAEEEKRYNYNELMPFERKYNLLAQKAAGKAQVMNAGISNIFGGLNNYDTMNMLKNFYKKS